MLHTDKYRKLGFALENGNLECNPNHAVRHRLPENAGLAGQRRGPLADEKRTVMKINIEDKDVAEFYQELNLDADAIFVPKMDAAWVRP